MEVLNALFRYLLGFLLLQRSVSSWKMPDYMIGHRRIVEGFGLGPAPFPDFKDMNFELFGDAFLRDDSVKVTDAVQSQKGAIWSRKAYDLSKTNDLQIDLTFRVGGVDGHMFGDGFALWYVNKDFRGRGGDALGGPNTWNGLGVFFDTFNNQQLTGLKHPYVYGYVNDGTKNFEDLKNKDITDQGCHIPFRTRNSDDLEATNVRVTYRARKLSVMLQPYGADDWVQCFKFSTDGLPENGYIGVTAMTGGVVDKHQMIGVQLYNKILVDPYMLGVDYTLKQMPMLWEDMRHSGDIAREFEEWEKEIEEEVDDFQLSELYKDYYYNQYGTPPYQPDNYYGDSSGGYYAEPEFEKPSYKNNYRKDRPMRKKRGGKREESEEVDTKSIFLTPDEIEKIDDMISGTSIATEIRALNEDRRKRIRKFRKHMEAEFGQAMEKVNDLVKSLRKKEYELSRRIERLGRKLNVQMKAAFKEHEKKQGGWTYPFVFLFLIVVAGTGVAYGGYRKHMKTHLL